MKKKDLMISTPCLVLSVISGLISKDLIIGSTALFTALMMFAVAVGYLLINVYGIAKWNLEVVKNRKKSRN